MFADDLGRDFYGKIKGQRVLVMVNYDVDAICACKILQSLFKTDYISYTLVTVDFTTDLKTFYEEHHSNEKFVIFINCGGTLDIIEEIEPEEDIIFFILDSHRPIDVCNIYNDSQVVLLSKLDKSEKVPEFNDIFRDEDSENDDNDGSNESLSENDSQGKISGDDDDISNCDGKSGISPLKKKILFEDAVKKRKEKKMWEEKRDKIMFEYYQYSYYGKSSAVILFELAWKLSKDNFDALWCAILGLSEQYLMNKITETTYVAECGDLQNHVSRLTHEISNKIQEETLPVNIELEKDLRLVFYRHWSVKDSLKHSKLSASRLKLWTFHGEEKLHEMLAEIGIPLSQCSQKFMSMDLLFRKEFYSSLVSIAEKYGLNGVVFVTFFIRHGYGRKYSAADYVYGLLALLQSTNYEKSKSNCFISCLEALRPSKKDKLNEGIETGKHLFVSIFKQTQNALETKRVQRIGPFLYFSISQKSAQTSICNHPYGSLLLADFLLTAYAATRKNFNKALASPMVVCAPCLGPDNTLEENDDCLCNVVGIPPISQESSKNFFGKAFEKAAEHCRVKIHNTYLDSSVIQITMKDVSKFLDALLLLLS